MDLDLDLDLDLDIEEDPQEEMEVQSSMWPEGVGNEPGKRFNISIPKETDVLEEVVATAGDATVGDFKRLLELTNYSEKGSLQLSYLVKQWEHRQENASRLLREELDLLKKRREEVELEKLQILEQHRFEEPYDQHPVPVLDDAFDLWQKKAPKRKAYTDLELTSIHLHADSDSVSYWRQRAEQQENLLRESIHREQMLSERLHESAYNIQHQDSPVNELSEILKRADHFLHFILQTSPVVIGHQDKDLRYRFIYNHFPSLQEEDIIGRTDLEIFSGAGVVEIHSFKKEVLEQGKAGKREFTFDTELFGQKTFLIYVEPVFSKKGDTIGINYMGMEVTEQVKKREKMAQIREQIAVQKAQEKELNKTIHITEETMRAKQLLATMSHEIRSPLSGVVSMTEILAQTRLDREQKQLLNVMQSSGDLVLQLINDILDLSKVESGVMKLESTKFRPREVIKHVLQTAAASLRKKLILEGHVHKDVPVEVSGDVLRIRQILTNLISNAVKLTHMGKVGIRIFPISDPVFKNGDHSEGENPTESSDKEHAEKSGKYDLNGSTKVSQPTESNMDADSTLHERKTWLQCDVYDTGIGISESAIPSLFKKYMQASADHARKYGGTGLGLAICKQLVELMGGRLTVYSKENHGSTFTFILPYPISLPDDQSAMDDLSDIKHEEAGTDTDIDSLTTSYFEFHPRNTTFAPPSELDNIKGHESEKIKEGENMEASEEAANPKILLVEDNKINVVVAQSMMKQLGHKISVVNNGLEAVHAVQSYCFDLILMDVHMPEMDGHEATRIIRSFEKTGKWTRAEEAGIKLSPSSSKSKRQQQHIPIVAMTANTMGESAEECFASGMDSFLSKPVTFQKLQECLQQYIK